MMKLYFIDGRVDMLETKLDYPELEKAYSIDAADGVRNNYDDLNVIDNISSSNNEDDYVIISNQVLFLNVTDVIYIYNESTKEFNEWNISHSDESSPVEKYLWKMYDDQIDL